LAYLDTRPATLAVHKIPARETPVSAGNWSIDKKQTASAADWQLIFTFLLAFRRMGVRQKPTSKRAQSDFTR
jgi:hypothetical protein